MEPFSNVSSQQRAATRGRPRQIHGNGNFFGSGNEALSAASTFTRWLGGNAGGNGGTSGPKHPMSYPQSPNGYRGPQKAAGHQQDYYDPISSEPSSLQPWSLSFVFQTLNSAGSTRKRSIFIALCILVLVLWNGSWRRNSSVDVESFVRPAFVNERPYISSTYYSTTTAKSTLYGGTEHNPQIHAKMKLLASKSGTDEQSHRDLKEPKTRLAVLRPFCAFDAEALPSTFAAWETLAPCKAAVSDIGDEDIDMDGTGNSTRYRPIAADAAADLFLFYSQTFSDSPEAVAAVDEIVKVFNEPGGWSECFDNIYAAEANIPPELDLYIPSAQEEVYNWVNGPNRQFEAAYRIIQSGVWGIFDAFYLMEGDSIPIKTHWLDRVFEAIEEFRPFAILGAKYNGDKWDQFYEEIPYALLNHINGNGIYNVSHPLLERLVGQLEVEAPCPYNSIPYDFRMSQMTTEGQYGIVPKLAPKIMLNEDGQNITLSDNTAMFAKWWSMWGDQKPMKETPVIHNYAATNLIPRHLGQEYIIHGAKLYSPWDPTEVKITLVVSEWFADRSAHLLETLDSKEHPYSQVVLMLPPDVMAKDEYNETVVPVRPHHRTAPDYMDLCEAPVDTEWFMLTNSYHHVATHVDLMFTPGSMKPVIPFTPATYPFCFKFPYCKENINLAQRINPKHDKVVLDFDMVYHTETRNRICDEWKAEYGDEGEDLYLKDKRALKKKKFIGPKGLSAASYLAGVIANGTEDMYKLTDRSLYGARDNFIKVYRVEEKLDGLTTDELAGLEASGELFNQTTCDCSQFESKTECENQSYECQWRPMFGTCHPDAILDGTEPSCPKTDAPTMAPTPDLGLDMVETLEPTMAQSAAAIDSWYSLNRMFKTREHDEGPADFGTARPAGATASPTTAPKVESPAPTPAPL